ncbi:hypothetical protein IHO40_01165 [Wolbachia endosymbiont of Mansonella ozzardi]|uniref:hypothetical protein n=1 Tax=Wolbachia endosymbiont of Mansonella ozzardi TaxID=137464 RepID=UPI001CE0DD76|nr:hypothetical protein [Wolbachia endosymbiont of Mansonella ozzardi]MCA4774782.1 hypothetical protein [Wolbachia endosymbiont of Mansonella ozzardi]
MLEKLEKWGTDLTLKVKGLFTLPESQVYVKDLRKVMTYKDGRRCQYPKNYDEIVESGRIIEGKDSDGKPVKNEKGNLEYQLAYNGNKFNLALVTETDDRSYFTVNYLDDKGKQIPISELHESCFEPFCFSRLEFRKCAPVFEAQEIKNSKGKSLPSSYKLINSSVLTKNEKNKEGKIQEVVDLEGRNGELLYTSDCKKISTSFFEVRDQNGNLELDKSLISVPIVFAAGLARICARLLTFIPMKLGGHLISRQDPIVKFFGYLLFTPAMAVKNLVNMGATVLKAPILLFLADKKKYGDAYWTMWKHQLRECWKETKNDYSVVKEGKRSEPEKKDYLDRKIAGTWKELDVRRSGIEKELDKGLSKISESTNKSRGQISGKEKLQNASNEQIADKNQGSSDTHAHKVLSRRNSLRDRETLLPTH